MITVPYSFYEDLANVHKTTRRKLLTFDHVEIYQQLLRPALIRDRVERHNEIKEILEDMERQFSDHVTKSNRIIELEALLKLSDTRIRGFHAIMDKQASIISDLETKLEQEPPQEQT